MTKTLSTIFPIHKDFVALINEQEFAAYGITATRITDPTELERIYGETPATTDTETFLIELAVEDAAEFAVAYVQDMMFLSEIQSAVKRYLADTK